MIQSLSETIGLVRRFVPEQLVAPRAVANAHALAARLPDAFSASYFECRLNAREPQADFSTCVVARDGGRERLLRGTRPAPEAGSPLEDEGWAGVRRLVRSWADRDSLLHRRVPLIWLEFDGLDRPLAEAILPGVNLCVEPDYLARPAMADRAAMEAPPPGTMRTTPNGHDGRSVDSESASAVDAEPVETVPLIGARLAQFLELAVSEEPHAALSRCAARLPDGARIFYVSAMLSRTPATLKLNGIARTEQLVPYLKAIGWRGSIADIESVLATFCPGVELIRFDVTVGPELSRRVGIELFSKGLRRSPEERGRLLERLVSDGLCGTDKRNALLAWPGVTWEQYAGESSRVRLSRSWYAKIVCNADRSLEAKGYLGFTAEPTRRIAQSTEEPSF